MCVPVTFYVRMAGASPVPFQPLHCTVLLPRLRVSSINHSRRYCRYLYSILCDHVLCMSVYTCSVLVLTGTKDRGSSRNWLGFFMLHVLAYFNGCTGKRSTCGAADWGRVAVVPASASGRDANAKTNPPLVRRCDAANSPQGQKVPAALLPDAANLLSRSSGRIALLVTLFGRRLFRIFLFPLAFPSLELAHVLVIPQLRSFPGQFT